ncbi:MAG: DNA-processing protein DprA [Coriobacteriia bacterium]|nr:DNA-processing protein DprA [Coriobacteriia bacterium]MBS5477613.1 DNA-processing protein DprA [Coriobacteriia bacterium]
MTTAGLAGPRSVLRRGELGYPSQLEDMPEPPRELYVVGDPTSLSRQGLAVIGARRATPYGLACARLAARCGVELGLTIVSGAAVGCDQAGQREALERGGSTVAVLGGGADVVYPRSARDLLEGIVARGGAVVSLQRWGAPPARWSFVRRNAVIAGLSRALVICEAGLPSGTFSTAEAADEAGRDVLVFPGSFFSPNSRGSNYLLSQSGFLPLWDRDALQEALCAIYGTLRRPGAPDAAPGNDGAWRGQGSLTREQQRVLAALEACPARPEQVARALGVDAVATMRVLGGLGARGLVARLVDGRYSPTQSALLGEGRTWDDRRGDGA